MLSKVCFFVGLTLILTGVVLKILDYPRFILMFFFISGGAFKTMYMVLGFRSGHLAGRLYLVLLLFGLMLLFLSIILRNHDGFEIAANVMLVTAISIKVLSIVAMKRTARLRKVAGSKQVKGSPNNR